MKSFCKPKDCDVESAEFNREGVHDGFANGKLRRAEYRVLLTQTGVISMEELERERRAHECTHIVDAIDALCGQYTQEIRERRVTFAPPRQFKRIDGIKMKERDLCQESAKQQVFEHLLVHALQPLLHAKILPCQYGSIPGKGQVAGKRQIERLLRRKLLRKTDALQCDGKKAYPSTTTALVLAIVAHFCHKNKALIYLTEAVMANYPNGVLIIGGYWSTWAFNLVMSFILRRLLAHEKVRRGTRIRSVRAAVSFADDFAVFGAISNLVRAVRQATRWASSALGITIKRAWRVIHFADFAAEKLRTRRCPALDMMGYVVRRTYTVIRGGIFVRIRRTLLRATRDLRRIGYVPWWRAQRLVSYNGWIEHSDSVKLKAAYHVPTVLKAALYSVAWHARNDGRRAAA